MLASQSPVGTRGGVEWMRGPCACPRWGATCLLHEAPNGSRCHQETSTRPNTFQIGGKRRQGKIISDILPLTSSNGRKAERILASMYRVRYLEQNDKMSQQVRLGMVEEVYPPELLAACVQQSPQRQQKRRRLRHFTALSVVWFLLAMVLWSRLAQGRVWDKLT